LTPRIYRGRSNVVPGDASITRHMNQPVIRSGPNQIDILWRRSECVDHTTTRLRRHFWSLKDPNAFGYFRFFTGEIRADDGPAYAPIDRLEHNIARQIKHVGVYRRKHDWRGS